MKKQIATSKAPAAIGPYSQAVEIGDFVFTSGQLGVDPETGALRDGIVAQADQALRNVLAILEQAGLSVADLVKVTVFVTNIGDFKTVNEVYAKYICGDVLPARSLLEVAQLPKGGLIEIEAVAQKGKVS